MLRRELAAGVKADWVGADTVCGYDEMRDWLESQQQKYVLAVPETHTFWRKARVIIGRTAGRTFAASGLGAIVSGRGQPRAAAL